MVERTGLLDSAASELFDSLTSLAARLLHAPMAFLTLVDDRRSFWLSTDGVADGRENPVEESFCQYAIADGAPLVIGDATADTRVCNNLSVGLLGVRARLGGISGLRRRRRAFGLVLRDGHRGAGLD